MGADLCVGMLEFPKGKGPDWEAAGAVIDALSPERCTEILENLDGDLDDQGTPEWDAAVAGFKMRMHTALDELQCMWEGGHRCASLRGCSGGNVLVFGGLSWGDEPFEGYADVCAVADLTWKAAGGSFCE